LRHEQFGVTASPTEWRRIAMPPPASGTSEFLYNPKRHRFGWTEPRRDDDQLDEAMSLTKPDASRLEPD
jgi:hypothetical protein